MKEQNNKRVSIFTILIMVLCGLLLIYTIYSFISVNNYLSEYAEAYGAITLSEKLSYYMSSCFTYIIYICILLAIWWIRPRKNNVEVASAIAEDKEVEEVKEVEKLLKIEEIEEPLKDESKKIEPQKSDNKEETKESKAESEATNDNANANSKVIDKQSSEAAKADEDK